ncbi:hypothetical protein C7H19_10965 [Aphanothece hegewaldii CCALA 016]|uniref:Uncharacterized protein n=1 Tax=Aphanothece hegewaldii CCALA 016 TaxID=2107694 RepID=A0A2T1LXZ2_9CHRO|nr:hypothetical protein [Aphanothece hegewaldii]PSF37234.1 hypothetical protein C7H19_10965 [Aphanothece hegewaldii CCALA 016]
MKKIIFALLTLTTVSTFAIPVKADEVNMQNTQQLSTQIGNNNRSYQRSEQNIRSSAQKRYHHNNINSTGSVQDLYQDSYQEGSRNIGSQVNRQEIEMRTRYRR